MMKTIFKKRKPIMDVDMNGLRKMSQNLARTVRKSGFDPEHILYVERAGLLVGFEMAAYFGCGISGISSRRSGSTAKSKFKFILRFLPRVVTHFLRQLELGSNIHGVKKERHISCEKEMPPHGKRILLVDDAIDTGHSLFAVLAFLDSHGYRRDDIRIAVLTTTDAQPALRADYSLLDQVVCAFPWSYDSRQYAETQGVYQTEKYVLNNFKVLPIADGPAVES